jgi:hypothetical protein
MPETLKANTATFTITETGEVTGRVLTGKFTVKTRLSFKEQLARDQHRRELLGPQKGDPLDENFLRAVNTATVFAELHTRLTDAPSWWTSADNGLELEDDSIVGAVYRETMKSVNDSNLTLKKEADKATTDMKAEVQADKVAGA